MREYDYSNKWQKLLTPEIVTMLTQIHEYKGEQALFIEAKADVLSGLMEIAKIQSTEASNRIEGIVTTKPRLNQLFNDKTTPRNRDENEIIGYRDVLNTIHESHEHIPVSSSVILQLHRDLLKKAGLFHAGSFKNTQNIIAETRADGSVIARFTPVAPFETPDAVARSSWLIPFDFLNSFKLILLPPILNNL